MHKVMNVNSGGNDAADKNHNVFRTSLESNAEMSTFVS